MIVHEHDRREHGRRFLDGRVRIRRSHLVEKRINFRILEKPLDQRFRALIEVGQKPEVGKRMLKNTYERFARIGFVGRRIGWRFNHDVLIDCFDVLIKSANAVFVARKHASQLFDETFQIVVETDAFAIVFDDVKHFVANHINGFFETIEHEAMRIETAFAKPIQHGAALVKGRAAAFECPARTAGMVIVVDASDLQSAFG